MQFICRVDEDLPTTIRGMFCVQPQQTESGHTAFSCRPFHVLKRSKAEGDNSMSTDETKRESNNIKQGGRPSGKRPEAEKSSGERPKGVRPSGDRASGERPEGEGPEGERPEGERPEGERPEGERPEGEGPEGERPEGERPEGERPEGERPEGERPEGERPEGERPEGERPEGERPEGERPEGEGPEGERPEGERPEGERPEGEGPEGERPEGERPEGEGPEGERPEGERPEGERPEGERPEGERPEGEGPEGERPEGERPEGERPEGERPSGERPAGERVSGVNQDKERLTEEERSFVSIGDRLGNKWSRDGHSSIGKVDDGRPLGNRKNCTRPIGKLPNGTRSEGRKPTGERPSFVRNEDDAKSGKYLASDSPGSQRLEEERSKEETDGHQKGATIGQSSDTKMVGMGPSANRQNDNRPITILVNRTRLMGGKLNGKTRKGEGRKATTDERVSSIDPELRQLEDSVPTDDVEEASCDSPREKLMKKLKTKIFAKLRERYGDDNLNDEDLVEILREKIAKRISDKITEDDLIELFSRK